LISDNQVLNSAIWDKCDRETACNNITASGVEARTCSLYCVSGEEVYAKFVDTVVPQYQVRLENGENWVYGDGYFARGMIETPSEIKGEPNELSLFCISGYRARPTTLDRYTIRMDGLFSWSTNFKGGTVLTKPFTFEGSKMSVNFATSAFGYLCVSFCDEQGAEISGYNSGRLFGNTIDRPCEFEKSLTELNGKTVRMKISMKDAEFYSFIIK
jgi:hypothetical protein